MLSAFNLTSLFAMLGKAEADRILLETRRRVRSKHGKPQNPPNRKSRLKRGKLYCLKVRP